MENSTLIWIVIIVILVIVFVVVLVIILNDGGNDDSNDNNDNNNNNNNGSTTNGSSCSTDDDCVSGNCSRNICQAPGVMTGALGSACPVSANGNNSVCQQGSSCVASLEGGTIGVCTSVDGNGALCSSFDSSSCTNNSSCQLFPSSNFGLCVPNSDRLNGYPCTDPSQCRSSNCSSGLCQQSNVTSGQSGALCFVRATSGPESCTGTGLACQPSSNSAYLGTCATTSS